MFPRLKPKNLYVVITHDHLLFTVSRKGFINSIHAEAIEKLLAKKLVEKHGTGIYVVHVHYGIRNVNYILEKIL